MEAAHLQSERRSAAHYAVDAEVSLVTRNKASRTVRGRMFELSLDGCRVHAELQFSLATPAPIEVVFKVRGIGFRLVGTLQWADAGQTARIRFCPMARRKREALEGLLAELEAGERARISAGPKSTEPDPSLEPASHPVKERRGETRHSVDTGATVYFIDMRAKISGRIVDLSLTGCRIRTFKPFPVGIYRRVETAFRLDGLPFRLANVVQVLHNKFTVGIRFLNVSPRKRNQLALLIEEIRSTGTLAIG